MRQRAICCFKVSTPRAPQLTDQAQTIRTPKSAEAALVYATNASRVCRRVGRIASAAMGVNRSVPAGNPMKSAIAAETCPQFPLVGRAQFASMVSRLPLGCHSSCTRRQGMNENTPKLRFQAVDFLLCL